MSAEDIAARNAKIVELWNKGVATRPLSERFGMAQTNITDIISRARASGQKVREPEGRTNW